MKSILWLKLAEAFQQEHVTRKEAKEAAALGYQQQEAYLKDLKRYGQRGHSICPAHHLPIIVLAGRPYHVDPEINHGIDQLLPVMAQWLFLRIVCRWLPDGFTQKY